MPRYIIDFALESAPVERVETDFPDREAARMFALRRVSSFFEDQGDAATSMQASTTIRNEDCDVLDTIHSVADKVPDDEFE